MTSFAALQNIFDTYLALSWQVVTKEGSQINVNETFTIRFTLENKADRDGLGDPHLIFENCSLRVDPTDYSSMVTTGIRQGTDGYEIPFPDQSLRAQQSTFVDVELKAEKNMADEGWWPWIVDNLPGSLEKVADINVFADIRTERGHTTLQSMNVEIESD